MTAKEYLRRYRTINQYIDCKLEEIAQLRELATKLTPTASFDKNGNVSDKVGRTVAKIVDLEREVNAQIDELVRIRAEIEETITAVGDADCRVLLTMRYINGYSWRRIAAKMNYSEKHITGYIHRKALQKIEKLIPRNT